MRVELAYNKFLFFYLFVMIQVTSTFAGQMYLTDINSPYLTYKHMENISHKTPPNVKFYSSKDFKGKPAILIDAKGLTIEDKLVCIWRDTYKDHDDKRLLINVGSENKLEESCAKTGPIISQYGLFRIEVKSDLSKDFYEVTFNEKPLYIDKKQLADFDFHESEITQENNKQKSNDELYKNLLEQDKSLRVFLDNFKKCIKQKDKSCLPSPNQYQDIMEGWQDYVCAYHNYSIVTEASYCEKWLSYRCVDSSLLKFYGHCDEALKAPRQKLPKLSKKSEKELNDFLWKSLDGCFSKENPVSVAKDEYSTVINIRSSEQYDLECDIRTETKSSVKTKWELYSLRANPKGLPDTMFKIFGP